MTSIFSAFVTQMAVAWKSCAANYVAVYGTLRAGASHDIASLYPGIVMTGYTTLRGTLHDMGWYPGLHLQGQQPVMAEVYPLNPVLEQVLDSYEGLWPHSTGEFIKQIQTVDVQLVDGGTQALQVLVYVARPEVVESLPVIAASDWLAWSRVQQPKGNKAA